MTRKLDYKCPVDIGTMSNMGGHLFCSHCKKNVHDFSNNSDLAVVLKMSGLRGEQCVSIQTDRLSLVTTKISKWKLFLIIALNIKAFFIQKLYAQTPKQDSIQIPPSSTIVRTLNGSVLDNKTGKTVKFPTIEMYKFGIHIKTIKGDKNGNFTLLVHGSSNYADTVTLRIYSKKYAGSLLNKIGLTKQITKLITKIPKEGEDPATPSPEMPSSNPKGTGWTGRILD